MRRLLCVLPILAACDGGEFMRSPGVVGRLGFALSVVLAAWAVGALVERNRT